MENSIRTIGIAAGRSRRSSQTVVRDNSTVRQHIIFSVFDTVKFEYGNFIKINHIPDDMVGCRFFRKKESAGRNAMTQRDTADRYGTVFINDFGFCGVNQMEFHVVCHSFAEIFQLRREYPFEVGMAMYMQCSRAPHQSERRDKSHQSEAMVTVQMRYKYMVETRKLQFRAT